jgi:hypothetical protein
MKAKALKATCAAAGAFASMAVAPESRAEDWSLRLPKDDKVVFRGMVDPDKAGLRSPYGMLYGPGPVGALITLGIQSAVVDTVRSRQMQKLQEEADKVLSPYEEALGSYSHKELMQKALDKSATPGRKLVDFAEKPGTGWFVESTPVFAMTQDQKAIVMENAVLIYAPGASAASYQNIVRVVSQPKPEADPADYWNANRGEKLKEESATLLAHSLDLALREAMRPQRAEDAPQRTFRYVEGAVEKIERAELVSEYCNRWVIRNLRGFLMSVPARPGVLADGCTAATGGL